MRCSAIEAKRKLVKVIVQVLMADGTLVRRAQPAFQKRDHLMDPGQQFNGESLPASQEADLVGIAFRLDPGVSIPPVVNGLEELPRNGLRKFPTFVAFENSPPLWP
jgi:hypothetical protein